jgi:hypothetical protein
MLGRVLLHPVVGTHNAESALSGAGVNHAIVSDL